MKFKRGDIVKWVDPKNADIEIIGEITRWDNDSIIESNSLCTITILPYEDGYGFGYIGRPLNEVRLLTKEEIIVLRLKGVIQS